MVNLFSSGGRRRDQRLGYHPHRARRAAYRSVEAWVHHEGEIICPVARKCGTGLTGYLSNRAKARADRLFETARQRERERCPKNDVFWPDTSIEPDCLWEPTSDLEIDEFGQHGACMIVPLATPPGREAFSLAEPLEVVAAVGSPAAIFQVDACGGPEANKERMKAALPELPGRGLKDFVGHVDFGPAAFGAMTKASHAAVARTDGQVQSKITSMVEESVQGAQSMRGQRGERLVTEMMTSWCSQGLFMHGSPDSPVNRLVIPAAQHIFALMAEMPPQHPKRVDCLTTLASACQDCQQVQAREILRIFGDLTSQNATFEEQIKYTLVRAKEAALNCFISRKHPKCDLDHTQVQPWQQRPHLFSGYASLIGDAFGIDSVTAARSDRFLSEALGEIGSVHPASLVNTLKSSMSVREWLQTLLADINNQSDTADRLIDRGCLFKWAHASMGDNAHLIFYDSDRAAEFAGQDPEEPTEVNKFQPFLSYKVLVEILLTAGMLTWKVPAD